MSRQTKYSPAIEKRMVKAIRAGATYRLACLYAGISEDTFARWRQRGEKGAQPFADFAASIKAAEGEAAVRWLVDIDEAAKGGAWQASAWRLERRYPDEYGKQVVEQHHSGSLELHETLLRDALARAEELRNGHSNGVAPQP